MNTRGYLSCVFVLMAVSFSAISHGSALGDLAASMVPGTWPH